ncbi:MAG: hypothetical protein KGQ51_11765 [Planctomycetes bacterium]|nr:hypothetical protein [Planctomycetota bacterium]
MNDNPRPTTPKINSPSTAPLAVTAVGRFPAAKNLLNMLHRHAMLVLEANQPAEQQLVDLGWFVIDFETRTWQSWARTPPRPVRLWASFRLQVGRESCSEDRKGGWYL